ncbi:MAG: HEAT repeat domain-containing protein [Phycisphaerales bacterium]|nr:HEAT repeat domain-containing protein [Phycisphaerales bacterium]
MTRTALLLTLLCVLSGCVPIPKGFDSPEPAARMEAAVDAAERGDRSKVPDLIGLLDSDDPATRMVAIRSLERLTGQTLGYDYAAGALERDAAVQRWVEWWGQTAEDSAGGPVGESSHG